MCHQNARPCVTAEEAVPAEKCLLIYCKPVELYNILQSRAQNNPSFLPRCLSYKIEGKWKIGSEDQNVIFNYRDQNNLLQKTEVTRRFSCPFCLMICGSFKGLRCHLGTSHDLFKFEFWTSKEYRAVNVSVRADTLFSETSADESEPYLESYSYCSKPRKRKRPENPLDRGKNIYPHVLELAAETLHNGSIEDENGVSNGMDFDAANSNQEVPVARVHSTDIDRSGTATLLPNVRSRKLSSERSDSISSTLLQKRLFYHSHRAQPMALEQVLSDKDSEDEVDDGIVDREDRRMLDDFVDVTRDEKYMMYLWNSFVRKQRVLADGHVSWACEAFVRLHGKSFAQSPPLFWCWKLFMIKLWNHGLLDASSMNNCSMILQKYQDEAASVEKCSDTSNPEPQMIANSPEPQMITDSPEAEMISDSPEPQMITDSPEAEMISDTPEPQMITDSPEAEMISDTPEPQMITDSPEAQMITDTSEPQMIIDSPEPQMITDSDD